MSLESELRVLREAVDFQTRIRPESASAPENSGSHQQKNTSSERPASLSGGDSAELIKKDSSSKDGKQE